MNTFLTVLHKSEPQITKLGPCSKCWTPYTVYRLARHHFAAVTGSDWLRGVGNQIFASKTTAAFVVYDLSAYMSLLNVHYFAQWASVGHYTNGNGPAFLLP